MCSISVIESKGKMFQPEDYKNPVPSKRKAIQPAHGSKHIITEEARKSKNLLKSFWHGIAVTVC